MRTGQIKNINRRLIVFSIFFFSVFVFPTEIIGQTNPQVEVHLLASQDLTFNQTRIEVPGGAEVTVFILGQGNFHTFTIDSTEVRTLDDKQVDLNIPVGNIVNVTFTVPDKDIEIRFYCKPHASFGMEGNIIVAKSTQESVQDSDQDNSVPGFEFGPLILLTTMISVLIVVKRRS